MAKYAEQDILKLLTYGCNFIMIDAPRSVGKTYSTLKIVIRNCIKNGLEFAYICRTQDEKKNGVMEKAVQKVMRNEFPGYEYLCDTENMYIVEGDEKRVLAYCLALSESQKIKKYSYPKCKFMIFDEYMLEPGGRYVHGEKEPDLLLSIYHTIDREEDRVICILLGNNTNFYNPYHMHMAFRIPYKSEGEIYRGNNVVFMRMGRSEELNEDKETCKFLNMIKGTDYGNFANGGVYGDSDGYFIADRPDSARLYIVVVYNGNYYGMWYDAGTCLMYIDDKVNPNFKYVYAATDNDVSENAIRSKSGTGIIHDLFLKGRCRFTTPEIRAKFSPCVAYL